MHASAPLQISLLLWIGSTEIRLMEFPPGPEIPPVEHRFRMTGQSSILKIKTYIELATLMERHRFCALSGPGMDKHHFLTWLLGYGDPLVKRIVSTEERLSGTRESLLDLRSDLLRRFG